MKDKLFLLKPDFMDQGRGPYFCPGCAFVEGMLSFYPALRDKIEIDYIDFERPRPLLVAEIGEENQNCPKLVLGENRPVPERVTVHQAKGKYFISEPAEICRYLGSTYGYGVPHD
ncbi:MAG TPA: DUF3088 domain-containing protein [Syntrophorhabdaceae bacterium]|nr:DUF3088 domain-containing protein [Syntrophorhabdaceae bacterium]